MYTPIPAFDVGDKTETKSVERERERHGRKETERILP